MSPPTKAIGNTAAITGADNANLQKDENNVAYQVANNGVVQNQLDLAATFATNSSQSLNTMISNSSSINLVQVMMQLYLERAGLDATARDFGKVGNWYPVDI